TVYFSNLDMCGSRQRYFHKWQLYASYTLCIRHDGGVRQKRLLRRCMPIGIICGSIAAVILHVYVEAELILSAMFSSI
uniref:Nucleotidyl transferase domain-containing protein n=1 Tax=Parascaris univalens TaxID=6257 RepID=A0A915B0Q7_PARUN